MTTSHRALFTRVMRRFLDPTKRLDVGRLVQAMKDGASV